jgi:hypothetical protein
VKDAWGYVALISLIVGATLYIVHLRSVISSYENAPADTVRVTEMVTTVIHDTTFIPIVGKVVHDTVDLSELTRAQLEAAVSPFSLSLPVTITDDKEKVGVAFDMSLVARPLEHSITGLTFSNVRSTYPKSTATITKYVQPTQNLLDLYCAVNVGGLWNRKFAHDLAGSIEGGFTINISYIHLSFAPLVIASWQSQGLAGYVARLEVSTR